MAGKPKVSARGRRQKGSAFERQLVKLLQDAGLAAVRMPLSGADRAGTYTANPMKAWSGFDVSVPMLGRDHRVECKHHATGFAKLYKWLEAPVDLLVVRTNHEKSLAIMPLDLMLKLIAAAEAKK